ncbi:glycosyltransferase family 2 protein [Halioxenophilus sp. WMMB6]|uniref:glycosyltransferase family 2 protein n=1 Tax=Halioxenophilus sp. WMMB6 TaxID=3073815 RepID=UPI00295E5166|nr:glycosyltransferase [Halioxenophilus sp. WMMB6]
MIKRLLRKKYNRDSRKPLLSLVVIIYKMPEQAKKTLFSLSAEYQRDVDPNEYEVLVMENASDKPMGKEYVSNLKGNFRYFYRDEKMPTPVPAINEGAAKAVGDHIAIIVDGARMASPGVVKHMIMATRVARYTAVAVPGYHIGEKVQQEAIYSGYGYETEKALLDGINWPEDGYKLFNIACTSATSRPGFFQPIGESNCISVPTEIWNKLGGFEPRFTETGGGQVNLDFYKRVCDLDEVELVMLAGEGTFHQFHGGVTTGTMGDEREKIMQAHFDQYKSIRGEYYNPPTKRPMLFGTFKNESLRFVDHSINVARAAYQLNW